MFMSHPQYSDTNLLLASATSLTAAGVSSFSSFVTQSTPYFAWISAVVGSIVGIVALIRLIVRAYTWVGVHIVVRPKTDKAEIKQVVDAALKVNAVERTAEIKAAIEGSTVVPPAS